MIPPSEPYALAQPGGFWDIMVMRYRRLAEGRNEEAAALQLRLNAIIEADRAASEQQREAA